MASPILQRWFPWVLSPTIINGPMIHAACAHLAAEISKAGGLGFIPCTVDLNPDSPQLSKLDADLNESRERLGDSASTAPGYLAIGAGFITGHASITKFSETALPILKKHRPAAVWLFAPEEQAKPHRSIIKSLKTLETPPKVFVQVGNVTAAREAVNDGADVLVCQGIDAGGHQFRRGMGVVSLVLEVKHMLEQDFPERKVAVVAAGGIVNGKGVAAMMTLGADGVVMGTRFTVANESIYPDFRKQQIINATDGGTATHKSPFNDQIVKNALWGPLYDGRAIVGPLHERFLEGASLQECQRSLTEDHSPDEATRIVNTWAGTGVGLVTKQQPAADIVREVREEASVAIKNAAQNL